MSGPQKESAPALDRLAYSIAEVMEMTGLGRSFLFEEMKAGRLKRTKRGSNTLILTVDLLEYLEREDDGKAGD